MALFISHQFPLVEWTWQKWQNLSMIKLVIRKMKRLNFSKCIMKSIFCPTKCKVFFFLFCFDWNVISMVFFIHLFESLDENISITMVAFYRLCSTLLRCLDVFYSASVACFHSLLCSFWFCKFSCIFIFDFGKLKFVFILVRLDSLLDRVL